MNFTKYATVLLAIFITSAFAFTSSSIKSMKSQESTKSKESNESTKHSFSNIKIARDLFYANDEEDLVHYFVNYSDLYVKYLSHLLSKPNLKLQVSKTNEKFFKRFPDVLDAVIVEIDKKLEKNRKDLATVELTEPDDFIKKRKTNLYNLIFKNQLEFKDICEKFANHCKEIKCYAVSDIFKIDFDTWHE